MPETCEQNCAKNTVLASKQTISTSYTTLLYSKIICQQNNPIPSKEFFQMWQTAAQVRLFRDSDNSGPEEFIDFNLINFRIHHISDIEFW
uniref:Uncharacterized protein n=1 Tax=Rhizophora mucronata TaxID=61149 RepID=A0A2P2NM07_RHIMU